MFFAPPPHSQVTPPLTRDVLAPLGYQAGDFTYGIPAVWRWGEPATLVIGKYCSLETTHLFVVPRLTFMTAA